MKFTITDIKEFVKALRLCGKVVSKDDTRRVLQCVKFALEGGVLAVAALDGFNLVERRVAVEDAEDGHCIVEPKQLISLLGAMVGTVDFERKGNALEAKERLTGTSIAVPLVEGSFLQYEHIFSGCEEPVSVYVSPEILRKGAEAMADIGKENSAVRLTIDAKHPTSPILLETKDGTRRALVLPMRIFAWERK